MNDLSIKYKLNKKFEVFYQDRLLADGPVKTSEYAYDDIGAVITEVTDIYFITWNDRNCKCSSWRKWKIL